MDTAEGAFESVSVSRLERKRSIRAAMNYQVSVFEHDAQHSLGFVAGIDAGECAQVRWCELFDAFPDVFTVDRIGKEHFVVCESWSALGWTAIEREGAICVFDFDG